jgi:hypothetical protein
MAKKKSKKKDEKKKVGKKKLLKLNKKKDSKKKDSKKKDSKKKGSKKKGSKKKDSKKKADHSSNYNVRLALKKIRTLKTKEELLQFTEGEKRLTITKIIPVAIKRLK